MALRLTCSRGHQWDAANSPVRSHDTQRVCPQCGAAPVAHRLPEAMSGATLQQNVPMAAPAAAPRPAIAGYDILGELGRGGMGVVYKARHATLKRLVALKMVLNGADADPRELARFRAEAEAVARLQHPNIVQIYEVGEHEGRPYCALEYVAGGSLAQQLGGKALPPTAAAQLMAALAEGVHHAHEANIIHRDLKPANILLVSGGVVSGESSKTFHHSPLTTHHSPLTTPKITDFGLAKQLDDPSGQTRSGTILGTPSYMAPEQAMGKNQQITATTDVWALGAILYECLTGRPPFRAESSLDTMLQVASQEPVAPTKINPAVPRDLETICLKCLRKEPAKRYADARAFGEDLQRFLRREPIHARPVRTWERVVMGVRRRPALSAAALLLLLLSSVIVWQWHGQPAPVAKASERNDDEAREHARREQEAEAKERHTQYALLIAEADREAAANNFHVANQALDKCPAELRGWEWDYLRRLCNWGVRRTLTGFGAVGQVVFGKNGRLAVVTTSPGVQVMDANTGRLLATLGAQQGMVSGTAFHPDGKRLATVGVDKELRVYDVDSGKELYHRTHSSPLSCVAFSPRGDVLAVGGGRPEEAGELRLWNADKGDPLNEVRGLKGRIESLAFDAGGGWVNVFGSKIGLASFSVPAGQQLGEFPGSAGMRRRILFDPVPGRISVMLPYGSPPHIERGTVPVQKWDLEFNDHSGGLVVGPGGGPGIMSTPDNRAGNTSTDGAISLDGKFAAMTGGWPTQGRVRFWRGSNRQDNVTLLGHSRPGTSVSFAPDSVSAATGSGDGTVRIWDPTVRNSQAPLGGSRPLGLGLSGMGVGGRPDMVFSPDGNRLATLDADPNIPATIWDLHTGHKVVCELKERGQLMALLALCFSADGRSLAVLESVKIGNLVGRVLCVWNASNGQLEYAGAEEGFNASVGDLTPAPGGGIYLAAAGAGATDRGLRLYDRAGKLVRTFDKEAMWLPFPVSTPDGRRLAAISDKERKLVLWDTTTGQELLSVRDASGIARFSPDGRYLVFHDQAKKSIRFWAAATGKPVELRLPPQEWLNPAHFSADGKRLALPASDGSVVIWDVIEGKLLSRVRGHGTAIADMVFSADGRRLFTASSTDAAVRVWDTSDGREVLSMRHARGGVDLLALSPDGRRLASRGPEGARVWDATPLPEGVVPK